MKRDLVCTQGWLNSPCFRQNEENGMPRRIDTKENSLVPRYWSYSKGMA